MNRIIISYTVNGTYKEKSFDTLKEAKRVFKTYHKNKDISDAELTVDNNPIDGFYKGAK